ncbi:MAG TPA: SdrD B-like domain-containing protein [Actinotalea sp.]|nr:SdrD B-like domain-containing protein [Actinotalea sp.]
MLRDLVSPSSDAPYPSAVRGRRDLRGRTPARWLGALVSAALALLGAVAVAPAAQAAGTPDVAITVGAPAQALQGSTFPVTLSATNPLGPNGYNTSFSLLVPTGASLSSADPAPTGAPIAVAGGTVYLWSNVSDLLTGTTSSVTASIDPGTLPLGSLTFDGGAYVNSNPRTLPRFDAAGQPIGSTVTGFAEGTAATELVPFTITKDVDAVENELMRGVHDHRTAVTLQIDNSFEGPSTGYAIVDYLPAALEFLGCGTDDNSATVTEEYPGSGPLNTPPFPAPGASDGCPIPTSVETLSIDPPGAQPAGIYTVVTWDTAALASVGAGALAAGGTRTIHYVVGIPQNANTLDFQGATPDPSSGDQGSNLDNNTGPSTLETGTEQSATNSARLSGSYDDPHAAGGAATYTDEGSDTVTLEDLAIQKGASTSTITQGAVTTWTLDLQVSEYTAAATDLVVTDTLPNGLCPLGAGSLDAECAGGPAPSLPFASAVENADGTWTLVWDVPDLASSGTYAITFASRTREYYQANGADDLANPVRANDSWTNTVALTGTVAEVVNGVVQPTRPVADDSSAGQQADGITLRKEVAEPAVDGTCGNGAGLTWIDDVAAAPFGPGDTVCWRIQIVAPADLDTTNLQLADFLPDGYEYVSAATGLSSAFTFPVPTVDGQSITWDLTGAPDLDQSNTATVVVRSMIADPGAHVPGDVVGNLAKLAYTNTPGDIFQLREQANAPWKQPVLVLTKTASPTSVDGGDVVQYTITVPNTGDQAVVDVNVRDLLPAQVSCSDLVGGSLTAGFSCDAGNNRIDGVIASIAAGASGVVSYQVDVPSSVAPGTTLTNTAGVRTYEVVTNDGGRFVYVPADNIDPTLTPNTTAADDDAVVTVRAVAMTKSRTTSVVEQGNRLEEATPGEVITYTVTAVLPAETTITSGQVLDTVPGTLELLPATAAVGRDDTSGVALSTTATGVTVQLPGYPAAYVVGAVDETVTITFDARVRDAAGPVAGNTVTNTATISATGMTPVSASVGTLIVEPRITTTKAEADANDLASPGELIGFTVTVGQSSSGGVTSTAHDVLVVDTIPTSMTPVDAGGTVLTDGQAVPSGGVWNLAARTLTWDASTTPALAAVAPLATVALPYEVRVADPVPSPTSFTNTVVTTTRSLPATATGERGPGGLSPLRYTAGAQVTLQGPRPSLTKSVTPGTATIGEEVTFTIVATIPASVTTFDATVTDTLPAGMTYVATDSASCTAPVGCSIASVTALTPNGQQLGWFLGDLQDTVAVDRLVTIVYRARVADVGAAVSGAVLTNSARVASNLTNALASPTTVAELGTFTESSAPATAAVGVVEPRLVLTKTVADGAAQVASRRILPGETVTYSITLTNTGTSTAFDVVVTDATDPRFTAFVPVAPAGLTVTDADPSDGTLELAVPSIAVGTPVTIVYTLTAPMLTSADEVAGFELLNTADATYTSLAGTVPGERAYDDVDPDTVGLEVDVASLGDTVWFDLDGNGVQGPGEAGVGAVTVTVVYLGADGVFGTADDETHVRVTAADGSYLVENLPQGQYRVTLDAATLPAGTAVTSDLDGVAGGLGVVATSLTGGQDRRDVDFGIRGTGAVGDLVWLDLDADGVQDPATAEPGLGGVEVTVSWPVTGGLPAGSVTTTTDAAGAWSVAGVPAVDVTVSVDPTTFPPGTAVVSEPHGGPVDGTATFPLAPGATDDGFDFGLRGTGLIGDRLWVDTNRDGVQDAGEPGIPGADVEVRWFGVDGVEATADDAVVVVTTGADGAYLVEHLPLGEYSVTVLTLPTALADTYDEDSGTTAPDGTTRVTLTPAHTEHRTADFGFVAETGVGDRVWLDQDGDGVQDPGEPGIPGVEITVTSAGADGVLGTADDIVRTTTTGVDGAWSVTGLPAVLTRVEVTGGLPAGLGATFDADGIGTPGVSEVVLVADSYDDLQDFGYRGVNAIGDRAWVDVDRDGVQDAGEPGLGGLTVQVTYLGGDGVAGGGDDLVLTVVTATDGGYLVPGLPDGDHTVVVTGGVPAGYTPTWDETGAADGSSVVLGLGVGTTDPVDHLTADFGYGGTGALGGTVWLEREVDGTLDDPTEAGIPGIGIDVTWSGPDGVLGSPDDVVIRAVTGAGGVWLVEGMPPGPFVATVDPTTLPAGTAVVWDRENGATSPDGTLSGTLAPDERRLDVDTGVQGTSSIGDLVWVDQNRNGTRDAGDTVAPDVRIVVTWHGPDGVLGGGDDVTIEERTGTDGTYLADGLPAGRYTVTFDRTTFPRGTTAYADVDGGDPLVSTVDLAEGQDRTDVDLVLRPSALAVTGAAVGLLALLTLVLIGGGLLLRRRAERAIE